MLAAWPPTGQLATMEYTGEVMHEVMRKGAPEVPLCYAIVPVGRTSGFRAGFRPDSNRESLKIGPPAGLRPAGMPI